MKNPLVRYILSAVARYGIPTDALLADWRAAEGLAASKEPASDDLAPLFRAMARLRPGDPDLGLHVGEQIAMHAFNPVIYLALSSTSLSRSIGATIRFAEVLEGRASKLWTRQRGDVQVIGWGSLSPDTEDRHHHEFIAVGLVRAFAFLCDPPPALAAARFQHDHPGDTTEHERILGCTPTFGHLEHSALMVPMSAWTGKTVHADPEMAALHEAMLERAQTRLRDADAVRRARAEIRPRLSTGAPLAEVARSIGMSNRSLQRRLSEAGTTYRQLVDDTRRTEVLRLLEHTDASIEAVALTTGFTDPSSLHRAFHRWTGTTPARWRARA